MKVCLLNDSYPPVIDGVANVVLNYSRIMQIEGMADVCVVTPKYPNTDYDAYPYKVIPYQSIDTTKIVKGYRAGNPLDIKEIREADEFAPDIIHTHCPVASTFLARTLRAKTNAPVVFTYHTKFDEDIARVVKSDFLQKETAKFLVNNIEACDEVWVVSEGAGENLKSLGYEGDYRVVSNGVDFAKGRVDDEHVAMATKDYDLPKGVPVFLFVGRMISYKGVPLILDACRQLSDDGIDYRLICVGSGPDLEEFKETAKQYRIYDCDDLNRKGKCYFTGPIYDRDVLRAWNTRADLFLFPSTYDTNGIVVREAAACGTASVLIKNSCAAEGITDDRNGLLIEQSSESMYELLSRASSDLEHLHELGQKAMDEIYISWEDSVRTAHERYGELIEMKKSGILVPKITPLEDIFITMPDEIAESLKSFSERSERRFENMFDNVDNLSDLIYDRVTGKLHDFKDEAKGKIKEIKRKLEDNEG